MEALQIPWVGTRVTETTQMGTQIYLGKLYLTPNTV
jgi:hypothetical protein